MEKGRIAFAGAREQALARRKPSTRIIDRRGKALLPGFLDGHSHDINSLLVANQCKLYAPPTGPGKDVPSILAALKSCAAERKLRKGEMLMGYGYDDTVMPGNPARIDHMSMHGGVLNSLALKKYGISAATATPPGGYSCASPEPRSPGG